MQAVRNRQVTALLAMTSFMLAGCTFPFAFQKAELSQEQSQQLRLICQTTMHAMPDTAQFKDCVTSLSDTVHVASWNVRGDITSARLACAQLGMLAGPVHVDSCAADLQNKIDHSEFSD